MIPEQLQRLLSDSASLGEFITNLEQAGDLNKAQIFKQKKEYLDNRITQLCNV